MAVKLWLPCLKGAVSCQAPLTPWWVVVEPTSVAPSYTLMVVTPPPADVGAVPVRVTSLALETGVTVPARAMVGGVTGAITIEVSTVSGLTLPAASVAWTLTVCEPAARLLEATGTAHWPLALAVTVTGARSSRVTTTVLPASAVPRIWLV
ncbi:hypothetical protein D3C72_706400 [compost metagenome]